MFKFKYVKYTLLNKYLKYLVVQEHEIIKNL